MHYPVPWKWSTNIALIFLKSSHITWGITIQSHQNSLLFLKKSLLRLLLLSLLLLKHQTMSQLLLLASWKKPQVRMKSTQTDSSFNLNTSPLASTWKGIVLWFYLTECVICYLTVIFTYVLHTYIAIQRQTGEASFPVNKEGKRVLNAIYNYHALHIA